MVHTFSMSAGNLDSSNVTLLNRNKGGGGGQYPETIVYVMDVEVHFFFFGDAAFLDFGEEEAELEAAGDFAVFGLGAFGFLVGPALFDFLALDGDLGFAAADEETVVLEEEVFLSPAGDLLDLEAAAAATCAAELFFSAAVFFAFGAAFFADLAAVAIADLSEAADRLAGDFLPLAAALFFFFSAAEGLAAPDVAEANLKEPEAPFPLVCTKIPEATDAFRYFLMKGATFSASTL